MGKIIFVAISLFIFQALPAQDSASLKIKIVKSNFKEDTLQFPLVLEIKLQTKYKSSVNNQVRTFVSGKNMFRESDSIFIIPSLKPGIYFVKPSVKNNGVVFEPDWNRTVVCKKCDAPIIFKAVQLLPGEDASEAFFPEFLFEYKIGYNLHDGFLQFNESAYLDSIRIDFFDVLSRKEKRKIAKAQFKIEAFLTSGKEKSGIKVFPETLDTKLKSIIIKGFSNIKFWKQYMPDLISMINSKSFRGDKITLTSSELLAKNLKKAK